MPWAKFKLFYSTMLGSTGSTLAATSTENLNDYDVDYIYNMLETNMWQAEETAIADPQYITYDAGVGNTEDADYLVIFGHNLNTAGVTVTLQHSTTGAWGGEEVDAFTGEAPSADTVYLKEFTSPGAKRYWRVKLAGHGSTAPYMKLCIWGLTTELDWASSTFDPYSQTAMANVTKSYGGAITGTHTKYYERSLSLRMADSDDTLYQKVKTWWDTSGLKNVFVAWDTTNNSGDVWLMRPSTKFHNPFNQTGVYRDISINFTGRRED